MKKNTTFLYFLFFLILLFGCVTSRLTPATSVVNKSYIGMPIGDFIKFAQATKSYNFRDSNLRLESIENGVTIYRMHDYDQMVGRVIDTRFYFNSDGKLFKIEGGIEAESRQRVDINIKKN